MTRTCTNCGAAHERAHSRYCLECHAAYMREWRKANPMTAAQRARDTARSYANAYKKRGKIVQAPCCVCSSPDSQMHHPDHELPLVVIWLCRECHLAWHGHWKFTALRTWNAWLAGRQQNVARVTNDGSDLRDAFALMTGVSPAVVFVPDDPDAEKLASDVVDLVRRTA